MISIIGVSSSTICCFRVYSFVTYILIFHSTFYVVFFSMYLVLVKMEAMLRVFIGGE